MISPFPQLYGETAKPAVVFFWKAGWASMGNIPLATVLNANGVMFTGIMSIAIFFSALLLYSTFAWLGITPESARAVSTVAQFKPDYTFWLYLDFAIVTGWMIYLHRRHQKSQDRAMMDHGQGRSLKRGIVCLSMLILTGSLLTYALS